MSPPASAAPIRGAHLGYDSPTVGKPHLRWASLTCGSSRDEKKKVWLVLTFTFYLIAFALRSDHLVFRFLSNLVKSFGQSLLSLSRNL